MRLPGASRDKPLIGAEQTTGLAGGHDFYDDYFSKEALCLERSAWILSVGFMTELMEIS